MISIKKSFLICLVFTVCQFVISCAQTGNEVGMTSTPMISTDAVPTATVGNTPQPTVPVITPTISPTPLPPVKTQCVDTAQESQSLDLKGVVALEKKGHELDFQPGFYLMNPKSKHIFYTDNLGIVTKVSPDGKYIAYSTPIAEKIYIRVLDNNGKLLEEFHPYYDGLIEDYFNWQNEKQLRIVTSDLNQVYAREVDPFTQEGALLKTDWEGAYRPADPSPDLVADWKFDRENTEIGYVYGANILYDPTLTRLLYPKDGGDVALIDVQSGMELAHGNFANWGSLPSWSPDGENLTIINREGTVDNFYLVSRDGEEFQRITDFLNEFDYVSIPEYTWSPDGQQIAFWLKLEDDGQKDGTQSELAILDIPTRQVTRLCIPGISNFAYEPLSMNHPEPIWSPDGRYIMFTQWDDPAAPKNYYVLVVDTETGHIEKISENTAPIGWMVNRQ
jgi:Tol biopolymer transport system component